MKSTLLIALFIVVLVLPLTAGAQVDLFGQPDTVFAELARVDDQTWTVTISYSNDEWIEALSLPFHISAGDTRIVGDSAIFTGGRVDNFDLKGFRADTAIQCVTMGLMANMGPSQQGLPPGSGRLVTVFISSIDDEPVPELKIDTTTTHPHNSLLMMAQNIQPGDVPDTIPHDRFDDLRIVPTLVVKTTD